MVGQLVVDAGNGRGRIFAPVGEARQIPTEHEVEAEPPVRGAAAAPHANPINPGRRQQTSQPPAL